MPDALTPLEGSVYNYLLDFTAENTYQPSIRDIGKKFQIKSTKTVSDLLQSLAKKGYIERDPARSRGVRLLGFTGGSKTKPVPYYGKIHAGEPSILPENRQGFITMDRRFIPAEEVYFLKVKGDSMIGRAISDGDFVMVNPAAKPKENDIVAARLGDEATVKTLISASMFRFEGQLTTIKPHAGHPCYRCLYPEPPPAGLVPNCQEAGVLGVLAGTMGILQASEAIKEILGIGETLADKLVIYDALEMKFRKVSRPKDPRCPLCSATPTIKDLGGDYSVACTI